MKRQYMNPTMKVVEIERHQQLLAGSDFGSGTKDGSSAAAPGFIFDDFDE